MRMQGKQNVKLLIFTFLLRNVWKVGVSWVRSVVVKHSNLISLLSTSFPNSSWLNSITEPGPIRLKIPFARVFLPVIGLEEPLEKE